MEAAIHSPSFFGWAIAVFFGLAALLKWKYRRFEAVRRVNRGLRLYASRG